MADASDLQPLIEDLARQDGRRFLVDDPKGWSGAVLLADEIKHYAKSGQMIQPFADSQLRPASYTLRLGDEMHLGGDHRRASRGEVIKLPPHQVAVVSTEETLCIPRFLVARWSLCVGNIYEGLLWTGGPQVDPGWTGQLYCPIYNLAERDVDLVVGDDFFTMDFIRTTAVTQEYRQLGDQKDTKKTWFVPKRKNLAEHDKNRLRSAPYEKLQEVQGLSEFRTTALTMIGVMFTAIGAVVAAVAIIAAGPLVNPGEPPIDAWFIAVGAAVAANAVATIGAWIYMLTRSK